MKVIKDKDRDGYFGIGIIHGKTEENLGTLWRSAAILGASFIFTIDHKYKHQSSDVQRAWRKIPLFQYKTFDEFYNTLPYSCKLIGVEMDESATPIKEFKHPTSAVYLLGSESVGMGKNIMSRCHELVYLPGKDSLNVAVAGSIVMFDRVNSGLQ